MSHQQARSDLARYLDPNNPPIFTFELFKEAKAQLEKGGWMTLPDISGQKTTDPIPAGDKTKIILHSFHDIASGKSVEPGWHTLKGTLFDYAPDLTDPNEICCDGSDESLNAFDSDAEEWKKSKFIVELKAHLAKHAENMERVDTIMGFGLGRLRYHELTGDHMDTQRHPATSWLQHYVCKVIKDVLQEAQENEKEIEIYTQDPDYCHQCIRTLKEKGIHAERSAIEFFTSEQLLNEHTFVVSIAPSAPILQIVFDLTANVGGSAGILCDTFSDETQKSLIAEWPLVDPPSGRSIEYANREGNRDMILEIDDQDEMAGTWRGKPWTGNVFGASAVYLKKKKSTNT